MLAKGGYEYPSIEIINAILGYCRSLCWDEEIRQQIVTYCSLKASVAVATSSELGLAILA